MSLSPEFQPLTITNYETCSALSEVVAKCVLLNPIYWRDLLHNTGNNLFVICFPKAADQKEVLRELVKSINKAIIPSNDQIKKLPVIFAKYHQFAAFRRIKGYPHADEVMFKNLITQYESKGEIPAIFYTSAPLDTEEDLVQFSITAFPKDVSNSNYNRSLYATELKNVNPNLHQYFKQQKIDDDFDPNDAVMKAKIMENMNRKVCVMCKSENAKKRCSQCEVVYYCNTKCQKGDWQKHKVMCSTLRLMKFAMSMDMLREAVLREAPAEGK